MRHLHWTRGRNRSFGFNSRSSFKRHQCKKTVGSPSNIQNWKDLIFLFFGWGVGMISWEARAFPARHESHGLTWWLFGWGETLGFPIRICNSYDSTRFMSGFFGSFAHGFSMFFHVTVVGFVATVQRSHVIRSAGLQTGTNDFRTRATCVGWRPVSVNPCRAGSGNAGWCISPRFFVQVYPNSAHFFQLPTNSAVAALTLLNLFRGQDLSVLVEEAVAAIAVCFVTDLVLVDLLLVKFDGRADFFSLFPHHWRHFWLGIADARRTSLLSSVRKWM